MRPDGPLHYEFSRESYDATTIFSGSLGGLFPALLPTLLTCQAWWGLAVWFDSAWNAAYCSFSDTSVQFRINSLLLIKIAAAIAHVSDYLPSVEDGSSVAPRLSHGHRSAGV